MENKKSLTKNEKLEILAQKKTEILYKLIGCPTNHIRFFDLHMALKSINMCISKVKEGAH